MVGLDAANTAGRPVPQPHSPTRQAGWEWGKPQVYGVFKHHVVLPIDD